MKKTRREILYARGMIGVLIVLLAIIAAELLWLRQVEPPDEPPRISAGPQDLLDRKIHSLVLHHSTVGKAIEELQSQGMPIDCDLSTSLLRDEPVDLEWHDISLGDAMAYLFSFRRVRITQTATPEFAVINGRMKIAPPTALAVSQRAYDLVDLTTDAYWGYPPGTMTRDLFDKRIGIVWEQLEDSAGMHNWGRQPLGGTPGAFPRMDGHGLYGWLGKWLFITQMAYNHRLIHSYLRQLRGQQPAYAAALDTRFRHLEFREKSMRQVIHELAFAADASISCEMQNSQKPQEPIHDAEFDTPITITLDNVTLYAALANVLRMAGQFTMDSYASQMIVIQRLPEWSEPGCEVIDGSGLLALTKEPFLVDYMAMELPTTFSGKNLQETLCGDDGNCTFIGSRIVFRGDIAQRRRARRMIDCLINPMSLASEKCPPIPGEPSLRLAHFHCHEIQRNEALRRWRSAAGPNVAWRQVEPVKDEDQQVSIDWNDATPEDALSAIVYEYGLGDQFDYSISDGIIFVGPPGEVGDNIVCGYDVSALLDGSTKWYAPNRPEDDVIPLVVRKGQVLAGIVEELIGGQVKSTYWHPGRLVIEGTPRQHRRVFNFLRQILVTGKIPPYPEEQHFLK